MKEKKAIFQTEEGRREREETRHVLRYKQQKGPEERERERRAREGGNVMLNLGV